MKLKLELAFLCITIFTGGFLLGYYIIGPLLYGK